MVKKLPGIRQFRALNELWIQRLPWPNINPNIVTFAQIIPAIIAAIYAQHLVLVCVMLALTLFFDLADGAIAKKHQRSSRQGYYLDVLVDRLTEIIIFIPLGNGWLLAATINCALSMLSFQKNIHLSLPLRQAYLIYVLIIIAL